MGDEMFGRDTFLFSFKWWLFIFVSILLPLAFIYRFGSLWIAFPWYQLGINLASLVVFFVLLALGIASFSLIALLLLQIVTKRGELIVKAVNAIVGIFMLLLIYAWYFAVWIKKLFPKIFLISSNIKYSILLVIIGLSILAIIYCNKKVSLLDKISTLCSKSFKYNIVIALCSLIVIIIVVSVNICHRYGAVIATPEVQANASPSNRPNIIIITFDALSAKHTSLHNFIRNTTPELVKFGHESYVFNNMYSSSNWTLPSLASLMTGKQPTKHHMKNSYSYFIGESKNENLPRILKEAGYKTAAVVRNNLVIPWRINLQGFDHIDSWFSGSENINTIVELLYTYGIRSATWLKLMYHDSLLFKIKEKCWDIWYACLGVRHEGVNQSRVGTPEQCFEKAANFLNQAPSPFFLWVHILPPHSPYISKKGFLYTFLPEREFNSAKNFNRDIGILGRSLTFQPEDEPKLEKLSRRYDEDILYADHEVGKFLSFLKEIGVYGKTIIIVSSDHGESFEKGFWSHGGPYLYQSLIHVPLLIHLPGQIQGKRIDANVSHVDLAPTLLDLVGIETPRWMHGKSFKKALDGGPYQPGTKFSMNLTLENSPTNFHSFSIAAIHGDYKLIEYLRVKRYEMYDLKKDPEEEHNLIGQELTKFQSLKEDIDGFLGATISH